MNWNLFKKKDKEAEVDPLRDLTLSDLKPGFVFDYDLKTWQVTAQHVYDYDGDRVDEWEISCADEVLYLDREDDDELEWTLSKKIRLNDIDGDLRSHLKEHEDPPETISYNGIEYSAESSDVGHFYENCGDEGQEFIVWDYLDSAEKRTLSIEQGGDDELEASAGNIVEEFQFSDILPSG